MSKKLTMEYLKGLLKKVADQLELHPQEVSIANLTEEDERITAWEIRKFGGLPNLKKQYPYTEKDVKEIQRIKDVTGYVNKLEKSLAESLLTEEKVVAALKSVKPVNSKPYIASKKVKISRELNLVLSDLHIGSDISKEQTGQLDFGKLEESRRLARVIKEVMDYKLEHRDDTRLNVLILGDIIQNQLHDQRDGAPLAEQAVRAINLLNQALAQLSANFRDIRVFCNTGNHGRNTGRHHDRAVNQKWDSIETVIYYATKESCKALKNITFIIPKTPYVVYEVFNKKIFATHGDTVLNPGYPGKGIRTGFVENQINKINSSLKDSDEYSVFVLGHVHVASITHLSNRAALMTNGALVPPDEFAVSIGLLECSTGQYLFESVKDFPIGDCRFIRVTEEDDKNPELDKIIKPWSSL